VYKLQFHVGVFFWTLANNYVRTNFDEDATTEYVDVPTTLEMEPVNLWNCVYFPEELPPECIMIDGECVHLVRKGK